MVKDAKNPVLSRDLGVLGVRLVKHQKLLQALQLKELLLKKLIFLTKLLHFSLQFLLLRAEPVDIVEFGLHIIDARTDHVNSLLHRNQHGIHGSGERFENTGQLIGTEDQQNAEQNAEHQDVLRFDTVIFVFA